MADDFSYSAEIELDTRKFESNLADAEKRLRQMQRSSIASEDALERLQTQVDGLRNAGRVFKTMGQNTEMARSSMDMLAKSSERLLRATNRLYGGGIAGKTPKTALQREEEKAVANTLKREKELTKENERQVRLEEQKVKAAERAAKAAEREAKAEQKRQAQQLRDNQRISLGFGVGPEADEFYEGLVNLRYAMYDVSHTAGMMGVALSGAATAAVVLGSQFESSFADVERTSGLAGKSLDDLQNQLITLTTEMPTSFADVSAIATLAGQLGIASNRIGEFTGVVTQFAATTDVSVEAAATGLGRLAQLAKVPETEYRNLGSAIYEVGVNSVATESAILNVAQQIAVSGNLAGFTADQIVALSGALASLGVAPEAARGSIMRIFNEITEAVDGGGAALERFASTANMSAEDFAATWRGDPQAAFMALIEGFNRTAESGGNLIGLLKDLGVWAVRDQRALQLLADNTEVYAQAINDSSTAYAEGTSLQEGFAVVAETLSAQMQTLLQTLQAIVAEGVGPLMDIIKEILPVLQTMAKHVLDFVQTDFGGAVFSWGVALSGMLGFLALGGAGLARLTGALAGFVTATERASLTMARDTASTNANATSKYTLMGAVRTSIGFWRTYSNTVQANTANLVANTTATLRNAAATSRSNVAALGMSGVMQRVAGAAGAARTALAGVARIAWPIAALWAVGEAVSFISEQMKDAGDRAEEIFGADNQGLASAIREDTAALEEGGEAYRTFEATIDSLGNRVEDNVKRFGTLGGSLGSATSGVDAWRSALDSSLGTQSDLASAVEDTTISIQEQTFAIGENARAFLASQLANNEDFQEFYRKYASQLEAAGADLGEALNRSLREEGGGVAYFEELISELERLQQEQTDIAADDARTRQERQAAKDAVDSYGEQIRALRTIRDEYAAVDEYLSSTISHMAGAQAAMDAIGVEFQETSEEMQEAAEQATNFADGLFDAINAQGAFSTSLYDLGESLAENGSAFDTFSQGGIANMTALSNAVSAASDAANGDMTAFTTNLLTIFAQLEGATGVLGPELDFLRVQLLTTFNDTYGLNLDISNARGSIHTFIEDAIRALQVRAELERRNLAAHMATSAIAFGGAGVSPLATEAANNLSNLNAQIEALEKLQIDLRNAGSTGGNAGNQIAQGMNNAAKAAGGAGRAARKAGQDAAKGAREATKEIRTWVDYANDLQSVFDRALDIRFGNQGARDDTTTIWQNMKDEAAEAAKNIRDLRQSIKDLRAELGTLAADRKILEFQLGVATEYGDELRAAEIRAELAENSAKASDVQNELKDTQEDLRKEQDKATKSLEGNSRGAIANRDTVMSLIQSYRDQLVTMAANGASTTELQRKAEQLRQEFVRQMTQMGYNRQEVAKYERAFTDFTKVIQKVPRNITVKTSVNTSAATKALNEWFAKQRARTLNVRTTASTPSVGTVRGGSWRPTSIGVGSGGITTPSMKAQKVTVNFSGGGGGQGAMRFMSSGGSVGYYATGGVHGLHPGRPRGSDRTPAWLTPGEFVMRREAVRQFGLPFMNAINQAKSPRYFAGGGYNGGGSAGGGVQLVELMPHQLRALANALSVNIGLSANGLANATNRTNARTSQRGSN